MYIREIIFLHENEKTIRECIKNEQQKYLD